ncbi:ATP-binding protein [Chitinophaga filiformis]|uniref:ATP-binding protein n=1 Tax=Chitinophaga filiformis TaxID=104663 RepID=UPI001F42B785|nr:ATP-binding protein [Chitinophaga filiformis]MCF6404994.1 ATP-binding protein [Chitinophaga filiformis]
MSIFLYNPDRKGKQEFISEFVIRTETFEQIFRDIKSGKMVTPEQHYLLFGQRGAGKTTLLLRLKYAVEDHPALSKWLLPVMFNEEQYNIGALGDLWERIAEYLEDHYNFTGITGEMEPLAQQDGFEGAAFKILIRHLDKHKKKILLLVDNIGQLLAKFEELEVRRLREVLQTIPHFRLVGASPIIMDSVFDYQQPFFEFFKMIELQGLTNEESVALLRQLAIVHHQEEKIERIIDNMPSRISTIRTLSGGIPRTMSLLFQIFVDNEHGAALSDLEKVLDAVTPLYKHRMDDLPAQQQKIVDAVALHWEAISVKDLTKQVRLDSKLISAQLRQLEKNQVIEKRATNTKNHIYLLKERFFNIWYLMRYGRKQDRNRVIWLVKFLESWCGKSEIEKRIQDYINKAQNGLLDKHTLEIYGQVYSFFQDIDIETRYLLNESIPEHIVKTTTLSEDDFYYLLNKKLQEEDYSSFLQIALRRDVSGPASRQRAFLYLEHQFIEIIADFSSEKKKEYVQYLRGAPPSSYFCLTLFLIWGEHSLMNSIIFQEPESVLDIANNLINLIQQYRFDKLTDKEEEFFQQIFYTLIVGGYYQLALKVLRVIPMSKQELEIWDKVINYMTSNNGKEVLSSFGAEVEESILIYIESITSVRRSIKKKFPGFSVGKPE